MQKKQIYLDSRVGNLLLSILCAVLLRWAVAFHSHSGQGKPPMFGDYEAQRHWMEITVNLDIRDWYRNTKENDLLYWGLDYPPLTAYHSFLLGKAATAINSSFVELHTSRGLETRDHKIFMRTTVFLADVFIFFTAIIFYFHVLCKRQRSYTPVINEYIFLALIYPGIILIDHGHFQYNCISLGLTVASLGFIFNEQFLWSAFFYCLALNYKQMSLYHSLPFFVYMLRHCIDQRTVSQGILSLLKLGSVVILTFAVIWAPFLLNINSFWDVLHRMFPVARGMFEDKVGNVWCAVNVVYKIKVFWSADMALRVCTLFTMLASIPSLLSLAIRPSHRRFLLSLINVSLAFFLFSYQVHEKSILLVVIPVLLYAPYDILPCLWFLGVSTVSLQHLIIKDNLHIVYISLSVIFYSFLFCNDNFRKQDKPSWLLFLLSVSALGASVIFFGFVFIPPPTQFPDFWALSNALYACAHFCMFYVYFTYSILIHEEKKTLSRGVKAGPISGKRAKQSGRSDSFD